MSRLFFIIALFFAIQSQAQIYVSNFNGNDLPPGDGTSTHPYKTIKKGVDNCPVDSKVFVDPGTYMNENTDIVITHALTLTKWVVGAPSTGAVIINAINRTGINNNIIKINGPVTGNVTIDNIQMKNLRDSGTTTAILVQNAGNDTIRILNCKIENIGWKSNDITTLPPIPPPPPSPITYSASAIRVINATSSFRKNVIIKKDTISDCAVGYGEAITIVGNVNGFLIDSNLVYNIANIGIDAAGNYSYAGPDRSRNGIISHNEVHHCMSGKAIAAGIYLDGSDSCIVEGNYLHHNAVGISAGGEQAFPSSNPPKGHKVRNNQIDSNSVSGMFIGIDVIGKFVNNINVHNNTFFHNRTGEAINGITAINNQLLSDTIYGPANIFGGEIALFRSNGLTVKNNIIYRRANRRAWWVLPNDTLINFLPDYNNYFQDQTPTAPLISIDGAVINGVFKQESYNTIQLFQSTWLNLEDSAREDDPSFVNPSLNNYRLLTTSLLINKGELSSLTNIVGTSDFYGNNRIICSRIDIGANEVNILAPTISNSPVSSTVCGTTSASFSITATGAGLSYQWQQSSTGCAGSWTNLANGAPYSGVNTNTLTINPTTPAMNGYGFRCVVTGTCAPAATSGCGLLTTNMPIVISSQPSASTICAGAQTSFTVVVTGTTPTYQWQESTNGGANWTNISNGGVYSGATTATLTLTGVTAGMTGYQYRVIVSGAAPCVSATSNTVILSVQTAPVITSVPANSTVCAGSSAIFSIAATGTSLSYQWQQSSTGCAGSWTNLANGAPYSGVNTNTLTINPTTPAMNGYGFRCVVTGTCAPAATSGCGLLTTNMPIVISSQPSASTICAGAQTSFTVVVTGTTPTYQWQESTNGGANWNNISNGGVYSGATTATLTLTGVTAGMTGYQYRVIINGAFPCVSVTSNAAVLTVNTATITITSSPQNSNVCETRNTTFTIAVTGSGFAYRWQLCTSGCAGTWSDIFDGGVYTGTNSTTLILTSVPFIMNGYAYRCVVSATCAPTSISGCARLTVTELPTVSIGASPYTKLYPGLTTKLTASAIPSTVTYAWYKNDTLIPGQINNVLNVNVNGLGNYAAVVTDVNGCTARSNSLLISDSCNDKVFIYPNPGSGKFYVRYYPCNGDFFMDLLLFDAKGARVFYRGDLFFNSQHAKEEINISHLAAGPYWLVLINKISRQRIGKASTIIKY